MDTLKDALNGTATLSQSVVVPDLWQTQAVNALREGKDVVVQAPTGAGKTLIFELWSKQGKNRGQAIYTVPTRALANDKLAEWRARGWDVGIATGDLAENLEAPILVATLETQKYRLVRGMGPSLLVVDEYQLIGDPDRGLNYELALALAPPQTQLLLLSGSVANPQDIVRWLRRLGRKAVLIEDKVRPVPLEEVDVERLSYRLPGEIRGYWARFCARALAEGLGPILLFAPRRANAESIANELARQLPCPHPLTLTLEQKRLVGEDLARMLKARVAYHHSGLSYAARAGVVEPLAKAGALRVVVATMGLAAGINFSLRSVALAGDSYRRDQLEQALRPDEILQMFGRAGRRGIDETGYVLVGPNEIRLRDGYPAHLQRNGMVDWNTLLGLMAAAAEAGREPFAEAVRVQERLFTTRTVTLGVEECLKNPEAPCGLKTDAERARHVRRKVQQMLNSRAEWENLPPLTDRPAGEVRVLQAPPTPLLDALNLLPPQDDTAETAQQRANLAAKLQWLSALSVPQALEKLGHGTLVVLEQTSEAHPVHGRAITVADILHDGRLEMVKWVRRLLHWQGRVTTRETWENTVEPLLRQRFAAQRLPVIRFEARGHKLVALVSLAQMALRAAVDRHGVPIFRPILREVLPSDCQRCAFIQTCRQLPTGSGAAMLWRRLGLVGARGVPTLRGRVVSFFHQGDGLAIAAGLEDENCPLDEMIYELANLDAGFRFSGDESRWAGRLAMACQKLYGLQTIPGYLENGLPPHYGAGAEQIVAAVHRQPDSKHRFINEWLGVGDIDRIIIEWRSTLRQIAHSPSLDWPRWQELQQRARAILQETESPTLTDLPSLDFQQLRRVDHRLALRRH
ncbi:DEAD/DEAH box helicase [Fontisphaera persica]|uniref:DEAD/DEAH box helicase n=1 Tax=Fontisphaera persica TaxID=2974023 RepID=UPI0024C0CFA0|nr:DEAD/DEAH box helicase [Fontisphaera persica]WCJ60401.1 DEAD/DEAH box helicase [Fontisphaera persica]